MTITAVLKEGDSYVAVQIIRRGDGHIVDILSKPTTEKVAQAAALKFAFHGNLMYDGRTFTREGTKISVL